MKLAHVIGGLICQSCMPLRHGASTTRTTTVGKTIVSRIRVQMTMASRHIIPLPRQSRDRAGRAARLIAAGQARVGRTGKRDVERHRKRATKRHPEPSLRMNQHPDRALPQRARIERPAEKRWIRGAIRRKQRAAVEAFRQCRQHSFGPAIYRIGRLVGPFRRGCYQRPPSLATFGADQHQRSRGRRAILQVGRQACQSNQPLRSQRVDQIRGVRHEDARGVPLSGSCCQRRAR